MPMRSTRALLTATRRITLLLESLPCRLFLQQAVKVVCNPPISCSVLVGKYEGLERLDLREKIVWYNSRDPMAMGH